MLLGVNQQPTVTNANYLSLGIRITAEVVVRSSIFEAIGIFNSSMGYYYIHVLLLKCVYVDRCEPPDINGPYIYMHNQWEDVRANEARSVEYTMIDVSCKENMNDSCVLMCINGTWTGDLPVCKSGK